MPHMKAQKIVQGKTDRPGQSFRPLLMPHVCLDSALYGRLGLVEPPRLDCLAYAQPFLSGRPLALSCGVGREVSRELGSVICRLSLFSARRDGGFSAAISESLEAMVIGDIPSGLE